MGNQKRWQQRFSDLKKAFAKLKEGTSGENLKELERDGVIQRFEFTFELAWKTLKDYCENQGIADAASPKKSVQKAFELGLIKDDEVWTEILGDRNRMSHIYSEEESREIFENIKNKYVDAFQELINALENENE